MNILVTGGAGFIGSHISDKLIQLGHNVSIIDNLYTGLLEQVNPKAKFYQMDIRDENVKSVFEEGKFDIVYHLAAQMSVPFSVEDPFFDLDVNGRGILNLLQNAVKQNVKKFIFSSTGGVIYGNSDKEFCQESDPTQPISPYGVTKLLGESYLRFYQEHYGLEYTVVRFGNVYGPRQLNAHESGVITIFARKILADEDCKLYAFENEPDGMIRDYVYIEDVVDCCVKTISEECGIYNVGNGIPVRTKEIFDLICEINGKKLNLEVLPARAGELRRITLNINKANEKLNWTPKYSLKQGLILTIDYFKSIMK